MKNHIHTYTHTKESAVFVIHVQYVIQSSYKGMHLLNMCTLEVGVGEGGLAI